MNKKENNKRFSKLIRKIMSEPNETPEASKLEVVKNIIKFSEIVEDIKVSILQSMN